MASKSSRYAAATSVSSDQSRNEIENTLRRYGADGFSGFYGWDRNTALLMFRIHNRLVRFTLTLPDKKDFQTKEVDWGTPATADTSKGKRTVELSEAQQEKAWEQASRQRWRALALVIKAKLEAVESGITTAENEFLAHIVLPDNTTLGQWAAPQIEAAYSSGTMPKLLPGG